MKRKKGLWLVAGRKMKHKKYSTLPEPKPLFSRTDHKKLARLVAVYGHETVAEVAKRVPMPRPRGRPAADEEFAFYEALHLLSCIDDWTEEARDAGSKHPVADAMKMASEIGGLSPKTMHNKVSAAVTFAGRIIDDWIDEALRDGRRHPLADAGSLRTTRDKIRAYVAAAARATSVPD